MCFIAHLSLGNPCPAAIHRGVSPPPPPAATDPHRSIKPLFLQSFFPPLVHPRTHREDPQGWVVGFWGLPVAGVGARPPPHALRPPLPCAPGERLPLGRRSRWLFIPPPQRQLHLPPSAGGKGGGGREGRREGPFQVPNKR